MSDESEKKPGAHWTDAEQIEMQRRNQAREDGPRCTCSRQPGGLCAMECARRGGTSPEAKASLSTWYAAIGHTPLAAVDVSVPEGYKYAGTEAGGIRGPETIRAPEQWCAACNFYVGDHAGSHQCPLANTTLEWCTSGKRLVACRIEMTHEGECVPTDQRPPAEEPSPPVPPWFDGLPGVAAWASHPVTRDLLRRVFALENDAKIHRRGTQEGAFDTIATAIQQAIDFAASAPADPASAWPASNARIRSAVTIGVQEAVRRMFIVTARAPYNVDDSIVQVSVDSAMELDAVAMKRIDAQVAEMKAASAPPAAAPRVPRVVDDFGAIDAPVLANAPGYAPPPPRHGPPAAPADTPTPGRAFVATGARTPASTDLPLHICAMPSPAFTKDWTCDVCGFRWIVGSNGWWVDAPPPKTDVFAVAGPPIHIEAEGVPLNREAIGRAIGQKAFALGVKVDLTATGAVSTPMWLQEVLGQAAIEVLAFGELGAALASLKKMADIAQDALPRDDGRDAAFFELGFRAAIARFLGGSYVDAGPYVARIPVIVAAELKKAGL